MVLICKMVYGAAKSRLVDTYIFIQTKIHIHVPASIPSSKHPLMSLLGEDDFLDPSLWHINS